MNRTSYDPRELAGVMAMLERSSELSGGSGRVPEWLSTHPDPGNRATLIQQVVEASNVDLSSALVRRNEYLRRIDGTVFGPNPREGFFEGEVFHHPDLAFRFTFPNGWQTVNTKQAVRAMSPNQDAAMELSLTEGSPAQALAGFGGRQGVQVGRSREESVNGLPAVLAEFGAAGQDGVFRGLALFVSHGGNTYRILGYAPETRWPSHEARVHESLTSFARETDARVLGAQPDRLRVVQLERTHTLQSFLQHYPSAATPEVVGLINGLESGGSLPAGTLAKRVVAGS
jgi:predicted Zn-dependent protease